PQPVPFFFAVVTGVACLGVAHVLSPGQGFLLGTFSGDVPELFAELAESGEQHHRHLAASEGVEVIRIGGGVSGLIIHESGGSRVESTSDSSSEEGEDVSKNLGDEFLHPGLTDSVSSEGRRGQTQG
ncbi:unnamed protein product, partial [Sphagnum tenellum]